MPEPSLTPERILVGTESMPVDASNGIAEHTTVNALKAFIGSPLFTAANTQIGGTQPTDPAILYWFDTGIVVPPATVLSFETDFDGYTPTVSPAAIRDNTVAHTGTYSVKLSGDAAWGAKIQKIITLNNTAKTYNLWFRYDGTPGVGIFEMILFGISTDEAVSAWSGSRVVINQGAPTEALGFVSGTGPTFYQMYLVSSLTISTWYRLEVGISAGNALSGASLFDSGGTLLGSHTETSESASASGGYLTHGVYGAPGNSLWIDDVSVA